MDVAVIVIVDVIAPVIVAALVNPNETVGVIDTVSECGHADPAHQHRQPRRPVGSAEHR
jgi:hypothetical protein